MKRIYSFILAFVMFITAGIIPAVYAEEEIVKVQRVCTATLEDAFADDVVIVTVDKEHSEINKEYTIEQFGCIDIVEIVDLTYFEKDPNELKYFKRSGFRQALELKLAHPGKEEVLKAIHTLERNIDFAESVNPDYYMPVEPIYKSDDEDANEVISEETPSDDAGDNDLWQIEETISEELPNEEITNESDTGEKHLRDIAKKAPSEMTAQREKPERAAYNDSERDTCAPLIGTDEIFTAIGAEMILRFAAVLIH